MREPDASERPRRPAAEMAGGDVNRRRRQGSKEGYRAKPAFHNRIGIFWRGGLEIRTKHEYTSLTFSSFGCAGAPALAAGGENWAGGDGLDGGTAEMRRVRANASG